MDAIVKIIRDGTSLNDDDEVTLSTVDGMMQITTTTVESWMKRMVQDHQDTENLIQKTNRLLEARNPLNNMDSHWEAVDKQVSKWEQTVIRNEAIAAKLARTKELLKDWQEVVDACAKITEPVNPIGLDKLDSKLNDIRELDEKLAALTIKLPAYDKCLKYLKDLKSEWLCTIADNVAKILVGSYGCHKQHAILLPIAAQFDNYLTLIQLHANPENFSKVVKSLIIAPVEVIGDILVGHFDVDLKTEIEDDTTIVSFSKTLGDEPEGYKPSSVVSHLIQVTQHLYGSKAKALVRPFLVPLVIRLLKTNVCRSVAQATDQRRAEFSEMMKVVYQSFPEVGKQYGSLDEVLIENLSESRNDQMVDAAKLRFQKESIDGVCTANSLKLAIEIASSAVDDLCRLDCGKERISAICSKLATSFVDTFNAEQGERLNASPILCGLTWNGCEVARMKLSMYEQAADQFRELGQQIIGSHMKGYSEYIDESFDQYKNFTNVAVSSSTLSNCVDGILTMCEDVCDKLEGIGVDRDVVETGVGSVYEYILKTIVDKLLITEDLTQEDSFLLADVLERICDQIEQTPQPNDQVHSLGYARELVNVLHGTMVDFERQLPDFQYIKPHFARILVKAMYMNCADRDRLLKSIY